MCILRSHSSRMKFVQNMDYFVGIIYLCAEWVVMGKILVKMSLDEKKFWRERGDENFFDEYGLAMKTFLLRESGDETIFDGDGWG